MSSPDPNFTERSRAILQEMAEIGLGMAYRFGAEREPTGETALAYSRVAKSVRQSIAMEAKITEGGLVVRQRQQAEHTAHEAVARRARIRDRADEIENHIIPVIEASERLDDWTEADEVDPLIDELGEILGYHMADADFLDRDIDAIIADICREMEIPVPDLHRPAAEVARSAGDETEGVEAHASQADPASYFGDSAPIGATEPRLSG